MSETSRGGGGGGLVRGCVCDSEATVPCGKQKLNDCQRCICFILNGFCLVTFQDSAPPPPPPSDMQLGFGRNSMMPFGNTTPATSGMC